jgi:5-methyltetrahydrofolate--homocysteine methyltransferase
MDHVTTGKTDVLLREASDRQSKRTLAEEQINKTRIEKLAAANGGAGSQPPPSTQRSDVSPTAPVPGAPFLGSRVVTDLNLDDIYAFINPVALFRGQWQVKKGAKSDAEYEAFIEDEIVPVFENLKQKCRDEKILQPAVVYGYFPCNAEGNDLIIWNPQALDGANTPGERWTGESQAASPPRRARPPRDASAPGAILERLRFPRQPDKRRLCISDFFRPIDSGETDVIGLHCVTMGSAVSAAAQELFKANRYTDYLYLHGLGVETAEALAEFWHKRMRQELGIANEDSPRIKELFTQHYRGSRYSFGYPACPDMSMQQNLFRLLRPERIGCNLTENFQIDPEQSTSAIIVHHPEAKYFNV